MKIVSFYSHDNNRNGMSPAAKNKLDYVVGCFLNIGDNIDILSLSTATKSHTEAKHNTQINKNITIHYPKGFRRKTFFQKVFHRLFDKQILKRFLVSNLNTGEIVYVYHPSVYHKLLRKIIVKKRLKVILEVEEIYSDVSHDKKTRKCEFLLFNHASAFVFSTQLLNNLINSNHKPYLIAHGPYKMEERLGDSTSDKRTHCVYAGTFNAEKGGVYFAIDSAAFLDENYFIHILGFGTKKEVQDVIYRIKTVQTQTKCSISYNGLIVGSEYLKFIQKCDIGLSTQNSLLSFNNSSFPSKILSYFSNGLKVVTIRLPVLEQSRLNDYLFYYNSNDPKCIAGAIKSARISPTPNYDKLIHSLDRAFKDDLFHLLHSLLESKHQNENHKQ